MTVVRPNTEQLHRALSILRKTSEPTEPKMLPPLEQLMLATLLEGTSEARAHAAFNRLRESFVDWNELRVTPPEEIADVMGGLPAGREKATAIAQFLNVLFEQRSALSLDFLAEKPKREIRLYLEQLPGVTAATAASVTLYSFQGHAIPVDAGIARVMHRLGLVGEDVSITALQAWLERHIPAKDGFSTVRLLRRHADEVCLVQEPRCSECPLSKRCPTATGKSRVASHHKAVKPESAKSKSAKPESAKSKSAKPESVKSKSAKPESAKPESVKSKSAKPASAKPESAKSKSAKPESVKLNAAKPGRAKTAVGQPSSPRRGPSRTRADTAKTRVTAKRS